MCPAPGNLLNESDPESINVQAEPGRLNPGRMEDPMEKIYRLRLDLIDWLDGVLMNLLDWLSRQRNKAWNAWDSARTLEDVKSLAK